MPIPNPDPRRERIATAADFNERCAKAFGWRLEYDPQSDRTVPWWIPPTWPESGCVCAPDQLPDFANSPEWCWKATNALVDAGWEPASPKYFEWAKEYEWSLQHRHSEKMLHIIRHTDLGKCTLLAFCEMHEAELDREEEG